MIYSTSHPVLLILVCLIEKRQSKKIVFLYFITKLPFATLSIQLNLLIVSYINYKLDECFFDVISVAVQYFYPNRTSHVHLVYNTIGNLKE